MKTRLHLTLLAAMFTAAAFPFITLATEQPAPAIPPSMKTVPAHPRLHARLAAMANQLGLTSDQTASIKAIRQSTRATITAIRSNAALTAQQQQEQIAALRQTAHAQMKAVLTADQQAELTSLRQDRQPLGLPGGRRLALGKLAKRLGLTSDQRSEIKAIRVATRAAVAPIRADANLTSEQKRAKVRDLVAVARSQMRAVLTPAQQQQFDQIRSQRRARPGLAG